MTSENELRKKIIEILADYKFNSTQIYTTEQQADNLIKVIKAEAIKEVEKIIDEVVEECDKIAFKHCFNKGKICEVCWQRKQTLVRVKQRLKELK